MAREGLMTWEGTPNFRWVKMYRGKRYRVTCDELGAAARTKEASVRLANDWWRQRVAEVAGPAPTRCVLDEVAKIPFERLKEMRDRGIAAEVIMRAGPLDSATREDVEEMIGIGGIDCEDRRAELLSRVVGPAFDAAVARDRTIRFNLDEFLHTRREQARAKSRSADGADNIRVHLEHWARFVGAEQDIDAITADRWDRWFDHCQAQIAARVKDGDKKGWSTDYAAAVFGTAKSWVKWLFETERLVTLPRTFGSRRHRFERPHEEPPYFRQSEFAALLRAASGQHRLHLLLMVNCGMTQADISDLAKAQIDLDRGYISRRRSKTRRKSKTPRVRYRLWPETRALLRTHLSGHETLALVTKSGRGWVRKSIVAVRLKKADNIATLFQRLRKKAGLTGADKSLKVFRKTAATRLKRNPKYAELRHFFLGHSPRTIADKHYAAESQQRLTRATNWLRRSLKIAEILGAPDTSTDFIPAPPTG